MCVHTLVCEMVRLNTVTTNWYSRTHLKLLSCRRRHSWTVKSQTCDVQNVSSENVTSLMKQQFVVTRTFRHNGIPALLDTLVANTSSVNIFYP
jgi:hypothetical protein